MSTLLGAAATWLGPILLEAGADQLKKMLGDGSASKIAGGIVDQIAGKLGVPPNADGILDAYKADPREVIQAVQEVDEHYAAIELARSETMRSQHQVQIAELGSGLLARIGRPLNTIFFAGECAGLMISVCIIIVRGIPASLDINSVAPLLAMVVPVLTIQAGIIGWDARQQTLATKAANS